MMSGLKPTASVPVRRFFVLAVLLSFGCIDDPPTGAGPDAGGDTDAQITEDVGGVVDSGRDAGTARDADSSDSGSDDAGDADAGPDEFYASPVPVDNYWGFENSLAAGAIQFESPVASFTDGIDGSRALAVASGQAYVLDSTNHGFPRPNRAFTVGAWFRHDNPGLSSRVLNRGGTGLGGWVLTYFGGAFNCVVFDANGISGTASVPIAIDAGIWHHVACKIVLSNETGDIANVTLVVNGMQVDRVTNVAYLEAADDRRMSIGDVNTMTFDFAGSVDEMFFSRQGNFGVPEIAKAWACGVSGRGCTCSIYNPVEYADCNRAEPDCSSLSPCYEQ